MQTPSGPSLPHQKANISHPKDSGGPLIARAQESSVASVVGDLLDQAHAVDKASEVAYCLVAAALDVQPKSEAAPSQDSAVQLSRENLKGGSCGCIEFRDCLFQVNIGDPDKEGFTRVSVAASSSDKDVWLLTRADCVEEWRTVVAALNSPASSRVVVTSVESFIGQNITKLGGFSHSGKIQQLQNLFERYNDRWIAEVDATGLKIEVR